MNKHTFRHLENIKQGIRNSVSTNLPCKSRPMHKSMTSTLTPFSQLWSTCSRLTACRRWRYLVGIEGFQYNRYNQLITALVLMHCSSCMCTLIIIGASNRTRDVTRHHCNHGSSQESGTCILANTHILRFNTTFSMYTVWMLQHVCSFIMCTSLHSTLNWLVDTLQSSGTEALQGYE